MNNIPLLRLDSDSYSNALGNQIFPENYYLTQYFNSKIYPEILKLQFSSFGYLGKRNRVSIHLGSIITLFIYSMLFKPKAIAEVGTFSGSSGLALASSFLDEKETYKFYTCDINPCNQNFIRALNLKSKVQTEILRTQSSKMFRKIIDRNEKIDMIHLDGRISELEAELISKLLTDETIILLDDCRLETKGCDNLKILKKSKMFENYFYCAPFQKHHFSDWNYNCHSVTGAMIPKQLLLRIK